MHIRLPVLIVALLAASVARADVEPLGGEFQVNTFTPGDQSIPRVCVDPAGRFTVAWQSGAYFLFPGRDGSLGAVTARRWDATGLPRGDEFVVNSYTVGPQTAPAITVSPSGDFVVAWQGGSYSFPQDGSESGAFVQRFSAGGAFLGGEFRANTTTAGRQDEPAVGGGPSGGFVVVWTSSPAYYGSGSGGDGDGSGVFGQRFDAAGLTIGPEFQVNTYTTGDQRTPRVASDATGGFVVVWQSGTYYGGQDGDRSGVFGQRFDPAGAPLGSEFRINTHTAGAQSQPAVAAAPDGRFVVAWTSRDYFDGSGRDGTGVFARRFDGSGMPAGGEFQVNTYTTGYQQSPAVAADASGSFTVVWESDDYPKGEDGDRAGIFGQHFAATGEALDEPFQVNTFTAGNQVEPDVAASPAGDLVVVWTSSDFFSAAPQDGSGSGVFGQRLRTTSTTPPPRLRGERLVLRDDPADPRNRRLVLRARDRAIVATDAPGDDPTVAGGTLHLSSATFDHTYVLPAANWRRRGSVWEYRDRGLLSGPIVGLVIRDGKLRVNGKGAQLVHTLASNPDPVSVRLQLGPHARQCLAFGGAAEFKPFKLFRARNAPPPATCR